MQVGVFPAAPASQRVANSGLDAYYVNGIPMRQIRADTYRYMDVVCL